MNYFELFGLPVSPVIDKGVIARTYFELQRQFHPDRFTDATEYEKEDSLNRTAAINNAFAIFKDEDKTLEYFLMTKGILAEDEKYELPPAFLMEMMELNEQAEDDPVGFEKAALSLSEDLKAGINPILSNYRGDNTHEPDLQKLKEYYFKKKYINRILDKLGD